MAKSESIQPTAAEIEAFSRDGVVILRNVIDRNAMAKLREGVAIAVDSFPQRRRDMSRGLGGSYALNFIWRRIEQYEWFIKESGIAALAAALLKRDAVVFVEDELFVKSPGVYAPTPWHHDQPYYPVVGGKLCSIWVPLEPIAENSALEFIAGSHRWGSEFLPLNFRADGTVPGADPALMPPGVRVLPDVDADRDAYGIVRWGMTPGDLLAFDGLTVHGNRANHAEATSHRVSFRFFTPDAVYAPARYPWTGPLSDYGIDEPAVGEKLHGEDFPLLG